jgi:hypothetical protein
VNKKKQKNFINFSVGHFQHRAKRSKKFFGSFFSKKNFLILLIFFVFAFDGRLPQVNLPVVRAFFGPVLGCFATLAMTG